MASSRDLDAPLNWRCGSPVCCLLRSAGCCCVWCDGWTGCHHHWRAGKYFQEQRTARHTHLAHHRRQFHRSAFLSRLLSRWHPARSWSPSLCHRTVAAVWATGPFIKAAGTLDRSSLGKRRWRRRISPECGCHCDDGISPGTDPEERALPAGWRRRREKNPPNLRIDRKRRATSHWRHRRRAMRPLGFGSPPASVWSGAFPPVDGALVPLDSRRKRAEKIRPRGTLGALILSCRLNRGLNWATSWGRCSAHARGNHTTSGGGKTGDGPRPNATAGRAFWALSKGAELDVDALGPEAERGPFCVPWADLSH